MKGTILLDLDGTLLINPMDRFVEAYLSSVQKTLSNYNGSKNLAHLLMQGTQRMVLNTTPARTLRQVFDEFFYPALHADQEKMQADIERFYAQEFPKLQSITTPRPGAKELVERLVSSGYRLAVATNPLFPLPAIEQRLAWAGLPVGTIPYQVVASYETFHFTKPHPAFFAEMLARMGWPEGPVVMIGEDFDQDIAPARLIGLPTFWTPPEDFPVSQMEQHRNNQPEIPGSTSMADAGDWIESAPEAALLPDFTTKDAHTATLRSTPAVIAFFLEKNPLMDWTKRPAPKEWAPVEVLCHLRDVEVEVNLPRVKKIVSERNPHLAGVDSDVWAEERRYLQQDFRETLSTFQEARLELLEVLDRLTDEDWHRPARHTILGKTDLNEIVRISASHERLHIRQLFRSIQK